MAESGWGWILAVTRVALDSHRNLICGSEGAELGFLFAPAWLRAILWFLDHVYSLEIFALF